MNLEIDAIEEESDRISIMLLVSRVDVIDETEHHCSRIQRVRCCHPAIVFGVRKHRVN